MTPHELDQLQRSLTETESALLIAAAMAMFSAIEAGASQRNLLARLQTHQKNYGLTGQPKAARIMEMFEMMVKSTMGSERR